MSMCKLTQDHWLLWLTYKKLISLKSRLLIVGLVWNFVFGMYDGRYVIVASLKVIPESLKSL